MLTQKQVIKKLLEFEESELRFKKIHENFSDEAVTNDFEHDYNEFINNSSGKMTISREDNWYSPIADFNYPRVLGIDRSDVTKNMRYHLPFLHIHNFFEFVFVMQGSCVQTINNKKYISKEGELYYISPGSVHSVYNNTDNSIVINILVTPKLMGDIMALFGGHKNVFTENIYPILKVSPCSHIIFKDKNGYIKSVIEKLCALKFAHEQYTDQLIASALSGIFVFCSAENLPLTVARQNSNIGITVYKILEYIKKHYKTVTLSDVCREFHFNVQYMSRLIKKETGKNFKEILNEIKVKEACKLLLTTKLRVIDIAYEVGFNSSEHFIRTFYSYMKVNPGQFRKR